MNWLKMNLLNFVFKIKQANLHNFFKITWPVTRDL